MAKSPDLFAVPLSVSDLTLLIKTHLEGVFPDVLVVGEISSLSLSKSGHSFFTLKDQGAQLPAVIWRGQAGRTRYELKNGLSVLCRGRLEVYPPYGKYQLVVTEITPTGIGALELAFRQLQEKLAAAGLFRPERKKPLPVSLRRVLVVTSLTGAALRDFLNVIQARSRRLEVIIIPTVVQGDTASTQLAGAIATADRLWGDDPNTALALIRGGGSMEDLWPFNEERTVRALASLRIPCVTGIGHEIDVSLADLVADVHALTPTDAAARLAPDDEQAAQKTMGFAQRLDGAIRRRLDRAGEVLARIAASPVMTMPVARIIDSRQLLLARQEQRIQREIAILLERDEQKWNQLTDRLEALSPLRVLARGYSLTLDSRGQLVRSTASLQVGDTVRTRLGSGEFLSTVQRILPDSSPADDSLKDGNHD